jgi:hypothetical protein
MIFRREETPPRSHDYQSYRPYLRKDFRNRCAYCLRHEGHNGGEANFCIDHYRPIRGEYGRPELECEYSNLYYACSECNGNKSDKWPSEAQRQQGYRFLNPCEPEDDYDLFNLCQSQNGHDQHFCFKPDGTLVPLNNPGKYTYIILVLWRPQLCDWRAKMYQLQARATEIETIIRSIRSHQDRTELERELEEIREELHPPVFDRPRGASRRSVEESLWTND